MSQPTIPRPEMEALFCCVGAMSNPSKTVRIGQLLSQPLDWPLLIGLARDHGLLLILAETISHYPGTQIPPESSVRLREENRQGSMHSLLLTAELIRVMRVLADAKIHALPYKGPVLAQLAYGNASLRNFEDLDIIAPQKVMPRIYEAMKSLQYESRAPRERFLTRKQSEIPGEYAFVHNENGALVEFHTECTLRHFPSPPDLAEMGGRAICVHIHSREIPTFSFADNLLMLCVHGAKDFWARLIWVADVAMLALKFTAADWYQLFAEAKKYRCARMVHVGLWLAHSLLETPLPAEVLQSLARDRAASRLGREIEECLTECRALPEGILWRSRYRIGMVRGLRGVGHWLHLTTAPAEEDWAAARSARVQFLLRPIRLWRKYGFHRSQDFSSRDI